MLIDGRQYAHIIRDELKKEVEHRVHPLVLDVISIQPDFATKQFTGIKQRTGESIGVVVRIKELPAEISTQEVIRVVQRAVTESQGIIIQLPLPAHIDTEQVLSAVPVTHDVDCLGRVAREALTSGVSTALPPVVGAFREILKRNQIDVHGKKVVVVGRGKLVGLPATQWFTHQGAQVTTVDMTTSDIDHYTKGADIIALGAGSPGLLTSDMISEGVVILDAGTSEMGGKTAGDADPRCAEKASLFTPVPGGIGPIAVAMIFKNLVELNKR